MNDKYILDGHTPVAEPDFNKWGTWFRSADRHVARDTIGDKDVSTVFLGIDHDFTGEGKPVLFETMIFPDCDDAVRYHTWEEAEAGHKKIVEKLRKRMKKTNI